MGADNSTPIKQNQRGNTTDRAIAAALERQKQMYEKKYEELRQAQKQSVSLSELKKSSNASQTPNNNVSQQPATQSSTPLYPNLNHIANNNAQNPTVYPSSTKNNAQTSMAYPGPANNNAQMSKVYASPTYNNAMESAAYASLSTSNYQRPSNTTLSQVQPVPSAPLDPAFEAHHSATQAVSKPRQADPGLSLTLTQHPLAVTTQSVPSPTTVTSQSVNKTEAPKPGSSQSQTQQPIAQTTPSVPSTSSATAQSVNLPHPKPKARLSLTQTQHPLAVTNQSVPSPTTVTSQSVNKTEAPKPGSSQSQTQQPIAQTTPAVPSTSSATAQSVNLPHPKPKARNVPRNKATPSIVPCVTCTEELGLTIYQCANGHSSCREFRLKQNRCGMCREPITDMRNITLEITIADIKLKDLNNGEKIKCPNASDGCRLTIKTHEVEGHLKECPYREMACPLTAIYGICNWKGKINQIGMHFKDVHPQHYEADVDKEMYLHNINVNDRIIHLVNLNPLHFLVYIEIDRDLETICMAVQTLGTKVSALKWTYELHVYNKREPRRKYHYIDTCSSYSESFKDIIMQKKCAVLNLGYAKTFLDNNNQLTYKFYIKKNLNPRKNQLK